MKLSDYVVDFLAKQGIGHNFIVTGGAVLHLADSTARHEAMEHIGVQHEQNGAAAADGYFRASGKLGVAMTTSGPGATNLTTSICNAYFDSVPLICVTGQVARFRLRPNKRLRQRGFQETDISAVFESITKYVKLVTDPERIRYELEKAVYIAQEGRPGPVVLDIPDDLQRVEIDPDTLEGFVPETKRPSSELPDQVAELLSMIRSAERPVLIYGQGLHCAKVQEEAKAFAHHFKLPMLLTWGATDIFPHTDPLNMGGVGVCGPRAGNFAAQSADLVIAIGTRLSQMITGGKQSLFAPDAKKVMVDIDEEELAKFDSSTFELDLPILTDLKDFFLEFEEQKGDRIDRFESWRECITSWKERYPVCTPDDAKKPGKLNPYIFVKELSKHVSDDAVLVTDTGANICWVMQAFECKNNQRIFSAWNHTPMGYALPGSVGAALGSDKEVICLIGDGGLMMCLQELATVSRYNLPIKIFIFDNGGHSTVKQTIEIWLEGRYVVVDKESGLNFPKYQKLAETFDLPYYNLKTHADLNDKLPEMWKQKGPYICHLEIDEMHRIVPMLKFGAGLEDLDPKLPDEEIQSVLQEAKQLGAVLT
ncbi:MAG: Acetolactate synthase isozyme 1 large subunit [Chlamydiia bacterium]|nr:Acetolactate synthase isozyme 1 large subunit [Chlamydiia bacterium]MCH9616421.1 Acetolactate synthase isozyme 1 large subunit [Chlamydiia bacterium]MCH9629593.1 Acetolactate synthase isozyme 1 large subunit [Chlamydiia bacterium]